MAILEQDLVIYDVLENGDKVIKMPITRKENVEGLEVMQGATSSNDGTEGLVPAPSVGDQTTKFLRADGTWQVPPDTNDVYQHPTSGVTAGTYTSVTVDENGHVTAGSNPAADAAVSAYKLPCASCSTAAATLAKVATITNGVSFSLVAGAVCLVNFQNRLSGGDFYSTPAFTLNVNSTGAKRIYPGSGSWGHTNNDGAGSGYTAQGYLLCVYDGTYWRITNSLVTFKTST